METSNSIDSSLASADDVRASLPVVVNKTNRNNF